MAFPTDVGLNALGGDGIGGPHISAAGNVYVFGITGDGSLILPRKATDPSSSWASLTTWSPFATTLDCVSTFQVGDVVYAMGYKNDTGAIVRPFDMATDSWGTATGTLTTGDAQTAVATIAVRSNGHIVLVGGSAKYSTMGKGYNRLSWSRWNGSAWSTYTSFDGLGSVGEDAQIGRKAIVDSADRAHFFYTNTTSTDSAYSRAVNSSDALETAATIGSIPTGTVSERYLFVGDPVKYLDGATEKMAVPYPNTSDLIKARDATTAATPTWSSEQTVSAAAAYPAAVGVWAERIAAAVVNENDTNLYAIWIDNTTRDIFTDNKTVAATTWGTDSDRNNVTADFVLANAYVRSGYWRLAFIYEDTGVLYYDEVQLSAFAVDTPPKFHRFIPHQRARQAIDRAANW